MKHLIRNVLVGLSILLPVLLSLQLIVWTVRTVEGWLRALWLLVIPEQVYFPGAAIITFLLLALVIGVTSRNTITNTLWKLPGRLMESIPLVNSIYGTIRDFLNLMGGKQFSDASVVWVSMPDGFGKLLGIVTKTGEDESSRLGKLIDDDEVAVFLPMSYQAGGYMLIVPKSRTEKTDMEPGEAIQLIMSAGLGQRSRPEAAAG